VSAKGVELILAQTRHGYAAGSGGRLPYWDTVEGELNLILFDGINGIVAGGSSNRSPHPDSAAGGFKVRVRFIGTA
jgi:hypothetical protein